MALLSELQLRVSALLTRGALCMSMALSHFEQARLALEAARAIQRFQLGAPTARGAARLQRGRAHTLGTAGKVARYRGQLSEAKAFQREALQLWQAAGDRGGAAAALHELGVLQLRRADWAAARTLLTQALDMKRRTKHGGANAAGDVAATLHQLAVAAMSSKPPQLDEARSLLRPNSYP